MNIESMRKEIAEAKTFLGIEFGSTRIKAVLISAETHMPIASSSHQWENLFQDGVWTYPLEKVWTGVQDCYQKLSVEVESKYGTKLCAVGAMGISGMMHGYLAFDKEDKQLVPFRTWRNTTTEQAAKCLTELFDFNIPQRWSIAHLYQAALNKEEHVSEIAYLNTIAGYVHSKLTGEYVLGVGEASGMFPIDSKLNTFSPSMIRQLDEVLAKEGLNLKVEAILPKVMVAGEFAGSLTESGAKLLDISGTLKAGIPFCPPEGDAGTGMVATNSVGLRTGNVSAGTSIFAMIVLEKALSKLHIEIDMVTTPSGHPVAMVHCNTCTSDLDAWVNMMQELVTATGNPIDKSTLYSILYKKAMEGDGDCGGMLAYNYYAGEPVVDLEDGVPMFVRKASSNFTLANFMRLHLNSAIATLKLGMDILVNEENVKLEQLQAHGGLFTVKGVAQKLMANALNVDVAVQETAGEGGPWGIAILAAFMKQKEENEKLETYLTNRVFANASIENIKPDPEEVLAFEKFIETYRKGIELQRVAVDVMK